MNPQINLNARPPSLALRPSARLAFILPHLAAALALATAPATQAQPATGTGLVASYYSDCINNAFFKPEKFVTTQTDPSINFNWSTAAPTVASGATITADRFSVRWKGKLKAPATGTYTLYLTSDDGTRLKVDNRIVIEGMVYQNAKTRSATLDLVANQTYDLQIDYFEDTGPASCVFEWSGPGIARQVVPTAVLYPDLVTEALAYPRTGWTPHANKVAILSVGGSLATPPNYQIKDASSAIVLSGPLTLMGTQWSNHHYGADLSSLTQPGTYTIQIGQKSGHFKIANDVHQHIPYHEGTTTIADMIGSLYDYQRCYHEKCINNGNRTHSVFRDLVVYEVGATEPTPGVRSGDMYGGWHDATSTDIEWIEMGMTILDMAMATERVTDPTDRAALLSEMRWGADYLLKTQYPAGGWPAQVWPDGAGKVVATPSTGVAGKCVSALAAVSALHQTSDPAYAQQCLASALKGWTWMQANPNSFTNFWDGTPGNVLAAAIELARATGQQEYFDFAATTIADGTWASNGYWIKSSGSFPGQKINDYWGQLVEVYWAQTPVALARFHAIAPPATKTKIATLLQTWVNIMKGRMNNPYSAAENMFVSWFGFSQHMMHTSQCLLHIGLNLNNREAIELGIKNYEFCTGFNPLGGSMGVGFGEDTLLPLFYRPQPDSIGGFIPGFKYENNRIHSDFLYSWDSWEVGETGLGSSSVLDVLAMMNEQALLDTVPPATPVGLAGTGWTTEIALRWEGVRSAASYQLKRATTLAGPFVAVADTTALEFTDTGLFGGRTYYYTITALGAVGDSAPSAPIAVTTRYNVALGKTATASSAQGNNVPGRAFDGDTKTRWESAFSDPQWLRVDLGDIYLVSTFRLQWEAASSKSYRIELSLDGSTWTTAYSTTTGPGGIETHNLAAPEEARYVRLTGTQRNLTYGHSLWEFDVYGAPAFSALESWRLGWYGRLDNAGNAADAATPHAHGLANLLVFGLLGPAQNPATARPSQLPTLQLVAGAHRYDFIEPAGVAGITYAAEWSPSLAPGSWTPLPDLGTGTRHIFEAPRDQPRYFLRLVLSARQ